MSSFSEFTISQQLPKNWDKRPVKILVASNFDSVAYDKDKDVLVKFYSPTCTHCKQFEPVYKQLAELYKDREDVVIAQYNGHKNDHPVELKGFPTIKLFKKGNNRVVDYKGNRTIGDLVAFMQRNGASPFNDDGVLIFRKRDYGIAVVTVKFVDRIRRLPTERWIIDQKAKS